MNRLRATFSVTTPLFGGGAAPDASAELRPPSVKGVLRFWWRALAWSRHAGDLKNIRAEEAAIFGFAGDEKTSGQASFLLRLVAPDLPAPWMPLTVLRTASGQPVGAGARYFGYGLMEAFGAKAGELKRPCLPARCTFTAELVSRNDFDLSVVEALKLMGLLGGLGSRTRRGWGSLSLELLKENDTEVWRAPVKVPEYKSELLKLLGAAARAVDEPPYSAFCKQTRIDIVGEGSDPLHLLNTVGEEMLRYRSWGKHGRVLGRDSERNFQQDHDWSKNPKGFAGIQHPRRVVFGLPHNYSKTLGVISKSFDRRASPLLVHIHRLTDQTCIAVITILHSRFLPQDEPLWVWQGKPERPGGKPERIPQDELRQPDPDWSALTTFAGRFPAGTKVLP